MDLVRFVNSFRGYVQRLKTDKKHIHSLQYCKEQSSQVCGCFFGIWEASDRTFGDGWRIQFRCSLLEDLGADARWFSYRFGSWLVGLLKDFQRVVVR